MNQENYYTNWRCANPRRNVVGKSIFTSKLRRRFNKESTQTNEASNSYMYKASSRVKANWMNSRLLLAIRLWWCTGISLSLFITSNTNIHRHCGLQPRHYPSNLCLFRKNDLPEDINEVLDGDPSSTSSVVNTDVLKFGGKYCYTSRSLPIPADSSILNSFFTNTTNLNVLLTSGREDSVVEHVHISSDSELVQVWKNAAFTMGAGEPLLGKDFVVKVHPPSIRILTVEICPETIVGIRTRIIHADDNVDIENESAVLGPEFQAVLIDDFPKANGPRPLVWLFNRIVHGTNSRNNQTSQPEKRKRTERALLRVWTEQESRTTDNMPSSTRPTFVFCASSEMLLEFEFPAFLLKFFPIKKQYAEEICSSAIVKALSLNLVPAIDRFADLYVEKLEMEERKLRE